MTCLQTDPVGEQMKTSLALSHFRSQRLLSYGVGLAAAIIFFSALPARGGELPIGKAPAKSESVTPTNLEELKKRKRFGLGVSLAGPLSVVGVEVDLNLDTDYSLGAGIGTGIDYTTYMVKARYFLIGEWVSPYFALGVARWVTDKPVGPRVTPGVLRNQFLGGNGAINGFDFWIAYPAFGVQFMLSSGIAFFAEAQAFFRLFDFVHDTFAGVGMHWYL